MKNINRKISGLFPAIFRGKGIEQGIFRIEE